VRSAERAEPPLPEGDLDCRRLECALLMSSDTESRPHPQVRLAFATDVGHTRPRPSGNATAYREDLPGHPARRWRCPGVCLPA